MAFKNKIIAFSLVEILVGITISLLLMVSIGVFVTSGMENIFLQQKAMQNTSDINNFVGQLYESGLNINKNKEIYIGNNFMVFNFKKSNNRGGITYIGIQELEEHYCEDGNEKTKHVFIKNFIPFIENEETLDNLEDIYESKSVGGYKSLQKEHKIVHESGNMVIGRGVFGDELEEGADVERVYLNSPTGLAMDGGGVLYISDTLNNRILYFKDDKIYKLLDETDGLEEPTGLYYENNTLYIANSLKGEILSLSSNKIIPSNEITFSGINESNVDEFKISFYRNGENIVLNQNIEISEFYFPNPPSHPNHERKILNNSIIYNFRENILNGSGEVISEENYYYDFSQNENYKIKLGNLLDDFEEGGVYTYDIEIGSTKKSYYYFTQGDGEIYTKNDNTLEIIHSGLSYPTGIWGKDNFNELVINESEFSQKLGLNKQNITGLQLQSAHDTILKLPSKELNIIRKNGLINFVLKYYRNYNCYNIDENESKINTYIYKINTN